MALRYSGFAGDARLQAASENNPPLRRGASGESVARLQQALVDLGYPMPISTGKGTRPPDGIYGDETVAVVRRFQVDHQLGADGIAGRQTLTTMDGLLAEPPPEPARDGPVCGNATQADLLLAATWFRPVPRPAPAASKFDLDRGAKLAFPGLSGAGAKAKGLLDDLKQKVKDTLDPILKAKPPTSAKRLDDWLASDGSTFKAEVDKVYKTSLDHDNIVVTNALGAQGRAFVLWMPRGFVVGAPTSRKTDGILYVNLGDWTTVTRDTVIHELAHCWQSQHASFQGQYMINAVKSQNAASAAGGDAYAYQDSPRKTFGEYAAEQIAQQVMRGVKDILTHIQAAAAWAIDADNDTSLATPRWDDPKRAGVK